MKTVAIIQSNYIPWKGYFDIIHDVDLFIFYDDVQYTVRDWRNRNKIKTSHGLQWLTIPVGSHRNRLIYEVEIKDEACSKKHWRTIENSYRRAKYFKLYEDFFKYEFLEKQWNYLSDLNQFMIREISHKFLDISTRFEDSRRYELKSKKTERLIDLLHKVDATRYVSGPAAKQYIDTKLFDDAGIELIYKDYSGYPSYPQLFPPFSHHVTILDLLFNVGPDAPYYIWGWRE